MLLQRLCLDSRRGETNENVTKKVRIFDEDETWADVEWNCQNDELFKVSQQNLKYSFLNIYLLPPFLNMIFFIFSC